MFVAAMTARVLWAVWQDLCTLKSGGLSGSRASTLHLCCLYRDAQGVARCYTLSDLSLRIKGFEMRSADAEIIRQKEEIFALRQRVRQLEQSPRAEMQTSCITGTEGVCAMATADSTLQHANGAACNHRDSAEQGVITVRDHAAVRHPNSQLSNSEIARYSRQLLVQPFGVAAQAKLLASKVPGCTPSLVLTMQAPESPNALTYMLHMYAGAGCGGRRARLCSLALSGWCRRWHGWHR